MKAVKAIYEKGRVKLSEKPTDSGPTEVLVIFPEPADDPWEAILNERTPRPKLLAWIKEVKKEIAAGKTKPLRLRDL